METSIRIDNDFICNRCSLPIVSTLGKRKVGHVDHDSHPSELSVSLSKTNGCEMQGICWIQDDEGRKFAFKINEVALIALANQINDFKEKVRVEQVANL